MNTVDKLIINARLQAAAEQAWREQLELHHAAVWKPGRILTMHLRMMQSRVSDRVYSGTEPPTLEPNPIAYGQSELLTNGFRVVFIANQYGTDWQWVACRFDYRGRPEYNYTQ